MSFIIDTKSLQSIFALPRGDGTYSPDLQNYFDDLSQKKSVALFAFPPKCGGTFLRSAAVIALQGQLYRASYAQGGGEMQFYLPTFIGYFIGNSSKLMVTHVHMQARESCCNFISLLNMKPVTMIRSVPDMLVSYRDQFLSEPGAMRENMICDIPDGFPEMSREDQADFMIYMAAPWYFSYYATWLSYAQKEPGRVLVLHFNALREKPLDSLSRALNHFGLPRAKDVCAAAIDTVWQKRTNFRFNKGVSGRGHDFFSAQHFAHLEKLLAQYPVLEPYRDELI